MKYFEMNAPPTSARQAFTLIELLVLVAIIATLAALLMPAIASVQRLASRTRCASQMRQVGMALIGYLSDNEDKYPGVGHSTAFSGWTANRGRGRWQNDLEPYVGNYLVFNCPTLNRRWNHFAVRNYQQGWVQRGDAPGGSVCLSAYNSYSWGRYASVPGQWWAPSAPVGPMTEGSVQVQIDSAAVDGIAARCPVFFDGIWQNDGNNQQNNSWGAYFPHSGTANFVFNDGHVETHAKADVVSWKPLIID